MYVLLSRPSVLLNANIYVVVFVQVQTEEDHTLFSSQIATIVALTKGCKSAAVVGDPSHIPAGCAGAVVTPTVIIHTLVRVSKEFLNLLIIVKPLPFRALWISRRKFQSVKESLTSPGSICKRSRKLPHNPTMNQLFRRM